MTDTKHTCCASVRVGDLYRWRPCGAAAKVERDGKHYCGRHDPVALDAKSKASKEKHNAELEAARAHRDAQVRQAAEHMRRSALFDDLLTALREAKANAGKPERVYQITTAAIENATKPT